MVESLLLVRHGATDWTREDRIQGHADRDLSDHGCEQVRALHPIVNARRYDKVMTSSLARCRRTAALLGHDTADALDAWREIHAGDWTGRCIDSVLRESPDGFADWESGRLSPTGSESRPAFADRVRGAYRSTVASYDGQVLLVTHAQVIREVISFLLAMPLASIALPDLASATFIGFRPSPVLRTFNVTADAGR